MNPAGSADDNESERLRALHDYDLSSASPAESLRSCVALAARICETPTAMVSLVDETWQWAFVQVGGQAVEAPRSASFCAQTIQQSDLFEIPDTHQDPRFAGNPLVTGSPFTRFYAGMPLVTPRGHALGTLCVTDSVPRRLSALQRAALRTLGQQVVDHLELRLLARRLQDQSDLLRLATDAVIVRDGSGTVLFWNKGAEKLYGWPAEEIVGGRIERILRIDDPDVATARERALVESGWWEGEVQQTTRSGRRIVVTSRCVVRQDSTGSRRAVLEINSDVTEQRRNAEERARFLALLQEQNTRLRELDRVKDDFIASISHEVRTPLASIRAYLDYLADGDVGPLNAEQRQYLEVIHRNADRVLSLVDGLLAVGRDAGRVRLDVSKVDLAEIAEQCAENLAPIARERQLTLDVMRGGGSMVEGDRNRLVEAVENLLSNAVKFTPAHGCITVDVRGDDSSVTLRVHDEGIGIPPDEQCELFERFYRGSRARDLAIPGSGLGLAICRTIVEAHGGQVGVSSVPDGGSTFRIELPASSTDL